MSAYRTESVKETRAARTSVEFREPDASAGIESYVRLVEPHRAELGAHCRRIVGSPDDAEDALQETLVRAWRGLGRYQGRGSVRGWLYRIATNAAIDVMRRRGPRVVRIGDDPGAGRHDRSHETVEIQDKSPGPEARYEQREDLRLAFEAARRILTPTQRAVLILRDVLGYSSAETADLLDTSVASANSALQRARGTLEHRASAASRARPGSARSGTTARDRTIA